MGGRGARVLAALVIVAGGSGLGRWAGAADRSPHVIAAGSTGSSGSGGGGNSSSNASSSASSGNGGTNGNGGTGGGGTDGGTGGAGAGGAPAGPGATAPAGGAKPGSDGSSGFGGSGSGNGGGSGSDGGPPSGDGSTATTSPDTVAAPSTTAPVPERDVRPGSPASCPSNAGPRVRCYRVDRGARGARVPDGNGGTVVVALPDASPVVNVDTGASTSASSNVDVVIQVDIDRGVIVGVDQRDRVHQAVLATLALLMLVAAAFACGALFMRHWGGREATS